MQFKVHIQSNQARSLESDFASFSMMKAGNLVLLAAKSVIKNPEEVNSAIVNGKQSNEYFHKVTGHGGHHLTDATAKYYKVNLTGKVSNCLSCSLEKIRQKNIPKKNEDISSSPGERMYLDISSMRKPSMGGRQHWEKTRLQHI